MNERANICRWWPILILSFCGCGSTRNEVAETELNAIRRAAYTSARLGQDTTALRWYRTLAGKEISAREREMVTLQIASLERIIPLEARASRWKTEIDSLKSAGRTLAGELGAQARQIRDLELQLKKATDELRQLKEIDARLSGRRP